MSLISTKQVQKLLQKLSPQQIQMIKLLELPAVQLEQRIKQEIEENPALEESIEVDSKESGSKCNIDEYVKKEDIPNYRLYANNYSKDDKRGSIPLTRGISLTEYLEEQLSFKGLDEESQQIGTYIIGSLDPDGYLRRPLESICDDLAFSFSLRTNPMKVKRVLNMIQTFEPSGVGARTLQECLLIQLKSYPPSDPVRYATIILQNYFDDFAKRHYDKIIHRLSVNEEMFRRIINIIMNLSPKPANLYTENGQSEPTIQIVPDFVLEENGGEYELTLNRYNMPDVKINASYVKMLEAISKRGRRRGKNTEPKEEEDDKKATQFIKQKLDSARWFISAIKQRNATLLLTMHHILEFQKEYFKEGDETNLKPMILRDIAERTGLDVSTISRVVNSKYIQTHFGVFSLKYFFSEAMKTDTGEEVSSREIKKILSDCVDQEDKHHPLTDEALMVALREKGYQIARRTVAKYREMLNIPVARLRREM